MVTVTKLRINQKSLQSDFIEQIYTACKGLDITIKRIFDKEFSFAGDDIILEGNNLNPIFEKIPVEIPNIVSIRFNVELGNYEEMLKHFSAMHLDHENKHYYFGMTLVDYDFLYQRLRVNEKEKILALLFRSLLGSKFLSIMPIKIKGVGIYDKDENTITFILPSQRMETIKLWLTTIATKNEINFDTVVDILKKTNPIMRKSLEDTLEWTTTKLPEIVAKSTTVEDINILKAYKNSFKLE